jgi:hypothetical protein
MKMVTTEKQAEQEAARLKLLADRQRDDLRWLMGHEQGRRIVLRLFKHCHVYGSVFDSNGSRQSFNVGAQDVGHELRLWVKRADPKNYLQMLEEEVKGEEE